MSDPASGSSGPGGGQGAGSGGGPGGSGGASGGSGPVGSANAASASSASTTAPNASAPGSASTSGSSSSGSGGPTTKFEGGSPSDPSPFGRYLLLGLIARGGMAEVYRAKPRIDSSDEMLAIKVMRPNLAKEQRFVEMFVREGKLAVMLEHEAIVRTIEINRTEGRYYIAMEYIGGKDLTQVLRRCQENGNRIPVPHACFIAMRMSQGLHYAHVRTDAEGRPLNVVNRDVSPSNVRLSYDGDVKLLDFGIAQGLLKFTSEIGVLKGKFSYMSPEQIRGMPVDARTDVFSTGIILHEMLTTEKLFRGDTEFALMEKVRKAEVPPPSKLNRRVPEALDKIVLKALARDVQDRYQSADELANDLGTFVAQYKFQQREMEEFIRGMFRADFEKETAEIEACRAAKTSPGIDMALEEVYGDDIDDSELEVSLPPPPDTNEPTTDRHEQPQKSGFWKRLKDRFRR